MTFIASYVVAPSPPVSSASSRRPDIDNTNAIDHYGIATSCRDCMPWSALHHCGVRLSDSIAAAKSNTLLAAATLRDALWHVQCASRLCSCNESHTARQYAAPPSSARYVFRYCVCGSAWCVISCDSSGVLTERLVGGRQHGEDAELEPPGHRSARRTSPFTSRASRIGSPCRSTSSSFVSRWT